MAAGTDGASSIQVTVRVRPFTIREAAQLTKSDDGPLFLGDGSLAAVPSAPKFGSKGLRSVIKVVDEKCLYVAWRVENENRIDNAFAEYSTHRTTIRSSDSAEHSFRPASAPKIKLLVLTEYSMRTPPRATFTRRLQRIY